MVNHALPTKRELLIYLSFIPICILLEAFFRFRWV